MSASSQMPKVVARYKNGHVLKGFVQRFDPSRDSFALTLRDAAPGEEPIPVFLSDLKAVFFVDSFDGEPQYTERKEFLSPVAGRRLTVRFEDGEVLVGTTLSYDATRKGFFLFPGDPQSNNEKVFVIAAFVAQIAKAS